MGCGRGEGLSGKEGGERSKRQDRARRKPRQMERGEIAACLARQSDAII